MTRARKGRRAHAFGQAAEDCAARLVEAQGGRIIARRWRCREGEIDLIAEEGRTLVFIEVKARRTHAEAAYALTARQSARLESAALRYISELGDAAARDMRFDVILVDGAGLATRMPDALRFDD